GRGRVYPGGGSGVLVGGYHQVDQLVQAIKVQPDRGQRSSIGFFLLGVAESGTGRLGGVARIQTLWIQEARQTIGKRGRLSTRGTCAIARLHGGKARLRRRWKASTCCAFSPLWRTRVAKEQQSAFLGAFAIAPSGCRRAGGRPFTLLPAMR